MLDRTTQDNALARLRKIEGQIRGIATMIQERQYCIDILTQLNAVRRALEKTALLVMQQHMSTCVSEAISAKKGTQKIEELMRTIDQFLR